MGRTGASQGRLDSGESSAVSVKPDGPRQIRLAYYLGWKAFLFAKFYP